MRQGMYAVSKSKGTEKRESEVRESASVRTMVLGTRKKTARRENDSLNDRILQVEIFSS